MNFTPNQIRAASWAAIALVSWLLLSLLAPVLMPFLLAAGLAYVLQPLVAWLQARHIPRWLGAGVAIFLLSLVLAAVFLLIVPVITKQVPLLKEQVPLLLDRVNEVDGGADQIRSAHPVGDDADAVEIAHDVPVQLAFVEGELVSQAGAAAGGDRNPESQVVDLLGLKQRPHLVGRNLGEGDSLGHDVGIYAHVCPSFQGKQQPQQPDPTAGYSALRQV